MLIGKSLYSSIPGKLCEEKQGTHQDSDILLQGLQGIRRCNGLLQRQPVLAAAANVHYNI